MKEENISDSEIRIVGSNEPQPGRPVRRWPFVLIVAAVAVIGVATWLLWPQSAPETEDPGVFEQEAVVPREQPHPLRDWLGSLDTVASCATATHDITVNDIPLRVYAPLNSTPHLEVGYEIANHRSDYILFFQAADVRADNKKIVGAFVLRGKPLSWGLSKRGYCAIINGEVTVGVADNSPLFERATEENGDFFRQYPLVDNGVLVESELKNKSVRRALCSVENRIVVVESQSAESMHDFAQALVDLGTANAIYLVGGTAMGWYKGVDDSENKMGLWDKRTYKNVNFIAWPKN